MDQNQSPESTEPASDASELETIKLKLKTPDCLKDDLKTLIKSSSLDPDYYTNIECDGVVTIAVYITRNPGYKAPEGFSAAVAINTKPQHQTKSSGSKADMASLSKVAEGPAIKDPPPTKDPLLP